MSAEPTVFVPEPARSDACVSDLVLDRAVASGAVPPTLAHHLSSCARCDARHAHFAAFAERVRPQMAQVLARAQSRIEASPRHKWSTWWLRSGVPLLAGAACLLVVAVWPGGTGEGAPGAGPESAPNQTRVKGSAMSFFVQRDGDVFRGTSGDAFRAGDAFRFFVDNPAGRFFLLAGVAANGTVQVFYPRGGDRAERLMSNEEIPIDASLVLDDDRQREYVVGVLSDVPLRADEVAEAIQDAMQDAQALAPGMLADVDMKATLHWVVLNKADAGDR